MEVYQAAFVAGFLGGNIGGGVLLLTYILVTRHMYKKRMRARKAEIKKQMNRQRHLDALEMQKKRNKKK